MRRPSDLRPRPSAPEVVGRAAELDRIGTFLDGLPAGPGALILVGEAGIGKSTVWLAGAELARARRIRVIRARPTEAEAKLPYAALNDLVGDLLDAFGGELPGPQRSALEAALLRAPAPDRTQEPLAVALAVLTLLRAAASAAPVLLAIDDLPWLDGSSAAAVEFALRRVDDEPIGLLGAQRSAPADPIVPLGQALAHRGVERLDIAGVTPSELDVLLERQLGLRVRPGVLARLARVSGGNPFYAIELARSMQRRGTTALEDDAALPESLGALVRDRLAALSEAARAVVTHAAARSHPTRSSLQEVLGEAEAAAGSAEAIAAGILVAEGDTLRFEHPLLAAEAYAGMSAEERGAIHRRWARVVAEPEENARHLALAATGPDPDVAHVLDVAARTARQRGAPDAAGELAEHAARLTPPRDDAGRRRRLASAARYLLVAGETERAQALIGDALDGAPPGRARAQLVADLAEISMLKGDWPAVDRLSRGALADAEDDVPLRIQLHLLRAAVGFITFLDWSDSARQAAEAMRLAEELGDPAILAGTIGHYATWRWATEHRIPDELIERARELEPWTGHLRTMDHPDYDVARMWATEGDRARALALWDGLARRAEETGDYSSLTYLLANVAEARLRDGEVEVAMATHERADRLSRSVGQDTARAHSLIWRVAALARLGREPEARDAEAEARALMARTGWRAGEAALAEHLAGLELSLGNAAAAHELLAAARERLFAGLDDPPVQRELIPPDVEALVALGRIDEARALLEPYEARAARLGRRPDIADGLRARGLLAAASGDVDAATRALEAALDAYRSLADPWGEARTRLALGQVHRRARRRAQAHESLAAALAGFERLEARIWADRARAELERGAPRREDGAGLTETQRRVAELVSAGRTNREVADALFMSIHTVEAHLSAIYRELGIRSRVGLVAALRDAGDGVVRDPGGEDPANE